MLAGRQHDGRVAGRFVLPNKLALEDDQLGVVVAAQRLLGGNSHRRDCPLVTRCLINGAGQGGTKWARDQKTDDVGHLSGTQKGGLVGLGT